VFMLGGLEFERDEPLDVEYGRALHGEGAAVCGLPLVVLLGEDRADESEHGDVVRKHAKDVGAPIDLWARPSGFVDTILRQWCFAKSA